MTVENPELPELKEDIAPKKRKRNKFIIGIMVIALIAAIYCYWYAPLQNKNTQQIPQIQTSESTLKTMTDTELRNEINRLYSMAKEYARYGDNNSNSLSSCASGLAIIYQNELILRELEK